MVTFIGMNLGIYGRHDFLPPHRTDAGYGPLGVETSRASGSQSPFRALCADQAYRHRHLAPWGGNHAIAPLLFGLIQRRVRRTEQISDAR
jgi:hypothetical protein